MLLVVSCSGRCRGGVSDKSDFCAAKWNLMAARQGKVKRDLSKWGNHKLIFADFEGMDYGKGARCWNGFDTFLCDGKAVLRRYGRVH